MAVALEELKEEKKTRKSRLEVESVQQVHIMFREAAIRQPSGLQGILYMHQVEEDLARWLSEGWSKESVDVQYVEGDTLAGPKETYVRMLFVLTK